MSDDLRKAMYECNAMDTLLVQTAQKRFEGDLREMAQVLAQAAARGG